MCIRDRSVALLTEDRRATGIMGVLSVADNSSIASRDALRKGPIMLDDKKILDLVATNKEKIDVYKRQAQAWSPSQKIPAACRCPDWRPGSWPCSA